ncbi:cohesin domain-containing protein [Geomonas azotofigens]|uniref:cohesin domain-containing protein n=1 Tax=Geomonas azotofigens TaxID=2843196 RepID=UPI001C0F6D93|nr:cohesin domain-containing protein [Geomonas azotofigens]MBU5614847.1 cohesin domain-containing protein [Geomonas azotofigens]
MTRQTHWLLLFLLLILTATPAFALPTLTISSPGSDGVFVLRGDQMDGVAGLDISIGYDSATLGNPRVTMGKLVQGMMSAANPGNPVRIAVVGTRALTGSGIVASIAFDRTGSSPGVVTLVTGTLIDASGKKVAMAQPTIVNPTAVVTADGSGTGTEQAGQEAKSDTVPGGATPVVPRPVMVGGTVTMPGQETATVQEVTPVQESATSAESPSPRLTAPAVKKRLRTKKAQLEGEEPPLDREENPPPPEQEAPPAPESGKPRPQVTQPVALTSVLDRFKAFQGERTPANLVALFRQDAPVSYSQLPPVAIADGKSTVTLVIGMATGDVTPSFTFSGCTYVSHRRTEAGWEIQARPKRDVVQAAVTMLYNGLRQEFPLTVAPKVALVPGKSRPVKESDFERFLKERGTPTRPRYDLNKDGRRDYVDDYIYAANYLVRTGLQAP